MTEDGTLDRARVVPVAFGGGAAPGGAAARRFSPAGPEAPFDIAAELADCRELDVTYEPEEKILWCMMKPDVRPCFSMGLLENSRRVQQAVERLFVYHHGDDGSPIDYLILGSKMPGVFNMGGDLALILGLVRDRDRDGLMRYARACIDVCYHNAVHGEFPFATISLVQGDALGGGFEAALSGNVLIAERRAQFGLPEVLFNLFPGMGAYHFLARRVGGALAEKLILGGTTLKATDLYDMGIVDVLADDGAGIEAVYNYVDRHQGQRNARVGVYNTRQRVNPIDWHELIEVGRIWVDAALGVSQRDLRKMERLVAAQDRRMRSDTA